MSGRSSIDRNRHSVVARQQREGGKNGSSSISSHVEWACPDRRHDAAPRLERGVLFAGVLRAGRPGGGWDQTARVMDEVLRAEGLIESSRIDNVGGAGGAVGLPQFVNQYRGDGEAIMLGGMVMIGSLIANKAPVALSAVTPLARLTGASKPIELPAASPPPHLKRLIDTLHADPGTLPRGGSSAA